MTRDGLPEFEERNMLPPIKLTNQQEEICRRLDALNLSTIQGKELSKVFRGAIYATREECRSNPDWISQSAHSFREILYPYSSKEKDAIRDYGPATKEEKTFQLLGPVYYNMTDVAHHQPISIEDYEKLIEDSQRELLRALDRQVDVHKQIDEFFTEDKPGKSR